MNDGHVTILGTMEPWEVGARYPGGQIERDGRDCIIPSFVVLRESSLAEWLRQVWDRGQSPALERPHLEGRYYLVQLDAEPPWLKCESAEAAPCPTS